MRVLHEEAPGGAVTTYLQIQLPELPLLRDFVLTLVRDDGTESLDKGASTTWDARPSRSTPGTYRMGLVYQPRKAPNRPSSARRGRAWRRP